MIFHSPFPFIFSQSPIISIKSPIERGKPRRPFPPVARRRPFLVARRRPSLPAVALPCSDCSPRSATRWPPTSPTSSLPPTSASLVPLLHPCFTGDRRRPWHPLPGPPGRCAGPTSPRWLPRACSPWRGGWSRRPWACPPWRGRRPCRPRACPPWAQRPSLGQGRRGRSCHLVLR